jgi:hypothetical protein
MRSHGPFRFLLLVAVALVSSQWMAETRAADATPDVATLIAHVGERLAAFYQRAQSLVCLERSTVVPIAKDWSIEGFARTVESDLRIETDASDGDELPEVRVAREIRRINGREPRDRDRTDRSGCTDPAPLSAEPLEFLLPSRRGDYTFSRVRSGQVHGRAALIIDFASASRRTPPELIADELGHDDCFDWKGPLPIAGRVWVDAASHDVLRLERRLAGPTDVRVPLPLQRSHRFQPWLTIDREDLTLSYKEVVFSDPDETVLLPESMESITVLRSGLQSVRRTQIFSGYRRFLTGSRIIKNR